MYDERHYLTCGVTFAVVPLAFARRVVHTFNGFGKETVELPLLIPLKKVQSFSATCSAFAMAREGRSRFLAYYSVIIRFMVCYQAETITTEWQFL